MEKKKLGKNIVPAGAGKSTLGFLIDFVLTGIMMVILYYAAGQPIQRGLGMERKNQQVNEMYEASFIIGKTDNAYQLKFYTTGTEKDGYGYVKYGEDIWNYYTVFVTGPDGAFLTKDEFTGDRSNPVDVGKWVYKKIYAITEEQPSTKNFQVPKNEANEYLWASKPVLSAEADSALKGENMDWAKDSCAKDLRKFYCDAETRDDVTNDSKGAMFDALNHFVAQPKYLALNQEIVNIRYYSLLPSFGLAPLIFFMIIPMFVPNGKTIGKLLAGTAVIGCNGYKARKINIFLHYFVLFALFELLLLPITVVAVMILMFGLLIDYMALILSKKSSQSLHDRIARTIVVNAKQSIWFVDAEAEEEYIRSHPNSNIAKIKSDERSDEPAKTADGRILYGSTAYKYDDAVLDASKIGAARREAENLTNFDEYEKAKSLEMDEHRRRHNELKEELGVQDNLAVEEPNTPKEPVKEEVVEEPVVVQKKTVTSLPSDLKLEGEETVVEDNDGFVDDSSK